MAVGSVSRHLVYFTLSVLFFYAGPSEGGVCTFFRSLFGLQVEPSVVRATAEFSKQLNQWASPLVEATRESVDEILNDPRSLKKEMRWARRRVAYFPNLSAFPTFSRAEQEGYLKKYLPIEVLEDMGSDPSFEKAVYGALGLYTRFPQYMRRFPSHQLAQGAYVHFQEPPFHEAAFFIRNSVSWVGDLGKRHSEALVTATGIMARQVFLQKKSAAKVQTQVEEMAFFRDRDGDKETTGAQRALAEGVQSIAHTVNYLLSHNPSAKSGVDLMKLLTRRKGSNGPGLIARVSLEVMPGIIVPASLRGRFPRNPLLIGDEHVDISPSLYDHWGALERDDLREFNRRYYKHILIEKFHRIFFGSSKQPLHQAMGYVFGTGCPFGRGKNSVVQIFSEQLRDLYFEAVGD